MRLQCLLVTQQHDLLELVRPALDRFGIDVEVRAETGSALEICQRRHLDGFLIDCDDVPGGQDLIGRIRASGSNRMSTIFAIVNGTTSVNTALQQGANFVVGKPLAPERFDAYVKIGRVFMEREHRRYFRFQVNLPIRVEAADGHCSEGRMVNISEGGMAARLAGAMEGTLRLSFEIPSLEPYTVEAKGDVVWSDGGGVVGIRFLHMSDEARRSCQNWLTQLHAQLELHSPETELSDLDTIAPSPAD